MRVGWVVVGQVMEGRTVSEVVASHLDGFAAGDIVFSPNGWQTHAVSDGKLVRKIDPALAPAGEGVRYCQVRPRYHIVASGG